MIHHKPIHQMSPGPTAATAHHMHHSVNVHQPSLQQPPPQQMHASQHPQHMNPNLHQSLHGGPQPPQQQQQQQQQQHHIPQKQAPPPAQQQPTHILQRDNRMNQQQRIQQPKPPAQQQQQQQQQQHYHQQQNRNRTISGSSNTPVNGVSVGNNVAVEPQINNNNNNNNNSNNVTMPIQQSPPQQRQQPNLPNTGNAPATIRKYFLKHQSIVTVSLGGNNNNNNTRQSMQQQQQQQLLTQPPPPQQQQQQQTQQKNLHQQPKQQQQHPRQQQHQPPPQQPQQQIVKKILQNTEHSSVKQHNGFVNNFNNNNNIKNKINDNDTAAMMLINEKNNLNVNNNNNNNINVINKEETNVSASTTILTENNHNNCNEQLIKPSQLISDTNLITATPTIQSITSQKSSISTTPTTTSLNIKEKTPMCLVNELARYNKIQHQYRLTSEHGPPHKKRFTVTLKLGEEEYSSDGASIKKAQHAAADFAVGLTKYKHPPAKTKVIIRNCNGGLNGNGNKGSSNITPTVELNALAMKRGEPTTYIVEQHEPISSASPANINLAAQPNNVYANFHNHNRHNHHQNAYNSSSRFNNNDKRLMNNRGGGGGNIGNSPDTTEETYHVTLQVGERKFIGIGQTLQSARHNAASKALEVLRPLTPEVSLDGSITSLDDSNSELKSPISALYEKALMRDLQVKFEVQSEKGPPHMKSFITTCRIGTLVSEGSGNGKKISKRRAAENMLEEFKKLPPIPPPQVLATDDESGMNGIVDLKQKRQAKQKRAKPSVKKKTRNLIKDKTDEPVFEAANPVSRLIQIQQARKEKVPVYQLTDERGPPRRREFTISVQAGGFTAEGMGPNKRIAKRIAAANLLIAMGMQDILSEADIILATTPFKSNLNKTDCESGNETKATTASADDNPATSDTSDVKSEKTSSAKADIRRAKRNQAKQESRKRKVTFSEPPDIALTTPTQKISIKKNNTKSCLSKKSTGDSDDVAKETNDDDDDDDDNNQMDDVTSTSSNTIKKSSSNVCTVNGIRPMDQLMYLAQLLGFGVHFCDFPKGNHSEYLTLVTLTTEPPQLCHGSGDSIEASNDQGAKEALRILSELGLDNVKPKNKDKSSVGNSGTDTGSSTISTSSQVVVDTTTKGSPSTVGTTSAIPKSKVKTTKASHKPITLSNGIKK